MKRALVSIGVLPFAVAGCTLTSALDDYAFVSGGNSSTPAQGGDPASGGAPTTTSTSGDSGGGEPNTGGASGDPSGGSGGSGGAGGILIPTQGGGGGQGSAGKNLCELGWKYRQSVTIHGDQVTGSHSAFPIFLDLAHAGPKFWSHVAPGQGMADLAVTLADGSTKLPREVALFSPAVAAGELHVPVDLVEGEDRVIQLYYGNPAASETNDPTVWPASTVGVWHLGEDPAGSFPPCSSEGAPICDSSAHHNDAVVEGAMGLSALRGPNQCKLGNCLEFDGIDDALNAGKDPSLLISGPLTLSFWFLALGSGDDAGIAGTFYDGYECTHHQGSAPAIGEAWHWAAFRWDGTTNPDSMVIFLDGEAKQGHQSSFATITNWRDFKIGRDDVLTAFQGLIDEVRIEAEARSDDWLLTAYANQSDPAVFATFGPEEECAAAPF